MLPGLAGRGLVVTGGRIGRQAMADARPPNDGSGGAVMATVRNIRNPIEWSWDQLRLAAGAAGSAGRSLRRAGQTLHSPAPAVRRIAPADLREVLAKGFDDFGVYRTDVIFLCIIYPVVGLALGRLAFGYGMLPLLFPLASGFALIGPFAAVGLYEMSRQREQGVAVTWANAFGVVRRPSFAAIVLLGLLLLVIFLAWMAAAEMVYLATLGPALPVSIGAFVRDVFTTGAGWMLIVVGCGVGFLFALLVLAISVVSFPLLVDREAGLDTAVWTSIRAVAANPVPMAMWGLIVAGALLIGSVPFFVGLIVVLPVLGHATWHLYRKVVAR
jgi:uncharacterized membrane protein